MFEEEEENVIINSDNIFGSVSSSPIATNRNPNFNFIPFNNPNFSFITPKEEYGMMMMSMEREKETGSGGLFGSDTALEEQPPPTKKKRLLRHTARQIQEMEAFFKENPHPDDKQKLRLSREIGLKPLQIKFWFQNKRTQIKAQQERAENAMLRAENETLKKENHNLQSDLRSLSCSSCGGSCHNLRLENSRLRRELDRLSSINPLSLSQDTVCFFPETNSNNKDLSIAEEEKAIVMDLAVSCVQELTKMCDTNEPLWNKKRSDNEESVCLNEEEYKKLFQWSSMDNDRFRREASRANGVVIMNSTTLVNAFLDAEKWSEMFCSLVSKAKTIQIISSGASGSLLLMYAELQVLSPLVPTREGYFLRYVEQNAEQGRWMVVDFPIDSFRGGFIKPASAAKTSDQYRRKPSGCIIQDMANGYPRVTWVEHVEVEEKHVHHEMVREYVKGSVAFGAERWLAVLLRQCERMASLMATNITDLGVIPSAEARKNLMKLSQRMVRSFCLNISNSYGQSLSGSTKDTVRITSRKVSDGLILCAVSTTFLPYSHLQVFDLLRDNHRLSQLEVLFNGNSLQELAHIANGSHPGNCISLLRSNVELMLQETCTDNSGSLVVYSTVDVNAVQLAMNGEDLSNIPLFPLGVSIVPVNPLEGIFVNSPSCLLTLGIEVLTSDVSAINNRIFSTVNQITSALGSSGVGN